jgi:hypothetical protein
VVDLAWVTARRQTTTMTLPWRSQASPWPSQRDDAPRPLTRLPAPRSCGPLRRPGVLLPVGGCAPAPRHARARGCGPWQPRHRPARRLPGGRPHGRRGSDGAGPGQRRAGPGLGSAIAQAAREPDLALAGRWGSAPRAGSGGSSRLTRRRPGRPSPRSASAGARGGHRPVLIGSRFVVAHLQSLSRLGCGCVPAHRMDCGGRAVRLNVRLRRSPWLLQRPGPATRP